MNPLMNTPPNAPAVPERPSLEGLEDRWSAAWEQAGTYRFDRSARRDQVFSIDTPPPTVSGSLHVGHAFSYTHTDVIARYRRMRGDVVFYPMGWDDNGLPTERRVETHFGVRCEPSLPYDPTFVPPPEPPRRGLPISRENFVELCTRRTAEDERVFEGLWRRLGLSVDWSITYTTIGTAARAASQRAFLRNLSRGEAYSALGPTMWDVTFRTAVAQAEIEDRVRPGINVRLRFHPEDGGTPVAVDTTRPELLAACVALVAHPDDERYSWLVGRRVRTPVFGVTVPVHAHRLADPQKGTGLVMVCTFGNTTDLIWWRELGLEARSVMGRNGWLLPDPPDGLASEGRRIYRASCGGMSVAAAKDAIVKLLRDSGDLDGEPRPIEHAVTFYEKGHRPLEIVSTRQWYLRNGARDAELRDALLARGAELQWSPERLRRRYDDWVRGLSGDWLISRQRFFGVPVPVWYPLDESGKPQYDAPLVPDDAELPVDPASACPRGYREAQRGQPGGFVADPDVMDTWATSSLTPQIAGGWERDPDLFERVFPMDLRPQAHEIIRTWLFSTVLRAHTENGVLPWRHAVISGWVVDPERRKMSKSEGNVTTPENLLREYGSDAVRYWAASARPGTDTAFETRQMAIGRRLATKVLHAGRFVLSLVGQDVEFPAAAVPSLPTQLDPLDAAMVANLADVVRSATAALDAFDSARALATVEPFFWTFCDDYLELVKDRAYGEAGPEAAQRVRAVLALALDVQLRLFAPVLPFVTEEVWSWWRSGSIHRAPWPTAAELEIADPSIAQEILGEAGLVLRAVRGAKSRAKVSMRAPVRVVRVVGPPAAVDRLRATADDLRSAGVITDLVLDDDDTTTEILTDVHLDEGAPAGAGRRRP